MSWGVDDFVCVKHVVIDTKDRETNVIKAIYSAFDLNLDLLWYLLFRQIKEKSISGHF